MYIEVIAMRYNQARHKDFMRDAEHYRLVQRLGRRSAQHRLSLLLRHVTIPLMSFMRR